VIELVVLLGTGKWEHPSLRQNRRCSGLWDHHHQNPAKPNLGTFTFTFINLTACIKQKVSSLPQRAFQLSTTWKTAQSPRVRVRTRLGF
jgi:hypothetical protein